MFVCLLVTRPKNYFWHKINDTNELRLHAVMLFVINMEAITEIPETEPSSSENGDLMFCELDLFTLNGLMVHLTTNYARSFDFSSMF